MVLGDRVYFSSLVSNVSSLATGLEGQYLTADIPVGALNGQLSVKINGIVSNSIDYTIRPIITSVTAPPTKGGKVTITGNYLNKFRASGVATTTSVSVGPVGSEVACTTLVFISSTKLTCTAPAGSGLGNRIFVTIDLVRSLALPVLNYQAPILSGGYQTSSTSIQVWAKNLGSDYEKVHIYFNGVKSNESLNGDDGEGWQQFYSMIPLDAKSGNFYVIVDGQQSNIEPYELEAYITEVSTVSTSGGVITISGYFMQVVDYSNNARAITAKVGTQSCTSVTKLTDIVNSWGDVLTRISCVSPSGTGINIPVTVQLHDQWNIGFTDSEPFPISYVV
eukprot:gene13086-15392_t